MNTQLFGFSRVQAAVPAAVVFALAATVGRAGGAPSPVLPQPLFSQNQRIARFPPFSLPP